MDLSSSSSSSLSAKKKPKSDLPDDLILGEIISRLSVTDVLECKMVSKYWFSTINGKDFAEKHLFHQLLQFQHFTLEKYYPSSSTDNDEENKDSPKIGFLVGLLRTPEEEVYSMVYKELKDGVISTKRIKHYDLEMLDMLIGSCNGLICILRNVCYKEVLYVCNPVTRECVYLPENESPELTSCLVSGFGYDSTANEYKVVRIAYSKTENNEQSIGQVQVYTLGSGSGWVNKETITHALVFSQPGAFLDGALHWLDKEGVVWGFSLESEKFHMVTKSDYIADGETYESRQELVVLGGWLCVLKFYLDSVELWSFKKTEEKQVLRSWIEEFCIEKENVFFTSFALTDVGQFLCSWGREVICLFDEDAEHMDVLEDTPPMYYPILHVNSFISLKGTRENVIQMIEFA